MRVIFNGERPSFRCLCWTLGCWPASRNRRPVIVNRPDLYGVYKKIVRAADCTQRGRGSWLCLFRYRCGSFEKERGGRRSIRRAYAEGPRFVVLWPHSLAEAVLEIAPNSGV